MSRKDRVIAKLAQWLVRAIYRKVEVRQREGLTSYGPQLANSSHFGGFADPLLLAYAMDRIPRFVARDVIWKIPPTRWLMNGVGAIPVHKPEDKGARTTNDQMFASTYKALHQGELITIFPEGITVDTPHIAAIKTGSARIALGARADGVEGLSLISAGIHYENKAALRSDVFVDIGWEIDLDAEIGEFVIDGEPADGSNRSAVKALTERMEHNLRLAAPDFEDWMQARTLSNAAQVALRPPDGNDPAIGRGDRERLARLLELSKETDSVVEAMDRYQQSLDGVGLDDEMFVGGLNRLTKFAWYVVRTLIIGLVLLPFALVGAVVNAVPMAIVWLIGRLRVDDAVQATIKPIGAMIAFAIVWGGWLWSAWRWGGTTYVAATVVLLPVYLFAVIAWYERVVLLLRAVRGLRKSRSIKDVYEAMWDERRAVVEAVAQAV